MYAPFQKLLYSADGKALAFQAGRGATIIVRDTATGNEIATLTPDKGSQALLRAFTPDRRCLALDVGDGTVTVYELASGQPRRSYGTKRPAPAPVGNVQPGGFPPGGIPGGMIVQPSVGVAMSPDFKLLALHDTGSTVHLWDVVTGKELTAFKGHTAAVTAIAFAPGGKTLASASADTTALVWDVTRVKRPALPVKALTADGLEKRWQVLAESDGGKSWAAMGDLIAAPEAAVAFLKDRVKPAAPLDVKRVEQLLAELDATQFKVRVRAADELLKLGNLLLPVIDKALAASPSLEAKKRLEGLRGKLTGMPLQGERLRAFRAVEVLELIGTPEARRVLQALANGAPGALVTTSAQSALKR
jgi:WD40 repeat protein